MHTLDFFNIFASLALVSAAMVIISGNPIHSVIFLILVFCNATGLLLLLKLEFLGMMFLIIYVGAIAVLFLFIVMMLNIGPIGPGGLTNWLRYLPLAAILGAAILFNLVSDLGGLASSFFVMASGTDAETTFLALLQKSQPKAEHLVALGHPPTLFLESQGATPFGFFDHQPRWSALIDPVTNIQSLGYLIYTYYFYYLIIASFILLIAMIGAIVLVLYKRKNASKKQLIFKQVFQNFEKAIIYTDSSDPKKTNSRAMQKLPRASEKLL